MGTQIHIDNLPYKILIPVFRFFFVLLPNFSLFRFFMAITCNSPTPAVVISPPSFSHHPDLEVCFRVAWQPVIEVGVEGSERHDMKPATPASNKPAEKIRSLQKWILSIVIGEQKKKGHEGFHSRYCTNPCCTDPLYIAIQLLEYCTLLYCTRTLSAHRGLSQWVLLVYFIYRV
ncbi:hypothetical protein L873DRAFT_623040 [Choiromyces venosus 120613-1]|uniref:Uncharacterized protein n=1 Tax=Choiromyces venosus 120613-1 TaxID=1336337 RepID=A0A3N4IUT8_9PEZI|nr:hypothetical protein L873DRAFT_623040 [Choiromyces venosus 120613-1]